MIEEFGQFGGVELCHEIGSVKFQGSGTKPDKVGDPLLVFRVSTRASTCCSRIFGA